MLHVLLDFERYGTAGDHLRPGTDHVCVCVYLSEVSCKAGYGRHCFGIVYVAVMLSFIYLTRCLPGGKFHGMADLLVFLGV